MILVLRSGAVLAFIAIPKPARLPLLHILLQFFFSVSTLLSAPLGPVNLLCSGHVKSVVLILVADVRG